MRRTVALALFILSGAASSLIGQRAAILRDVTVVQVNPTVVNDPSKVKEEFAANLVEASLRNALLNSNFEVGESPIRAHIVLEEFSSGSLAKRFIVGFGAGRSTVAGRLIFQDQDGSELANVPIRVRGSLLFSAYQGGNTQRRQATSSFDQKLIEEIARLKPAGPAPSTVRRAAAAAPATPKAVEPPAPAPAPLPTAVTTVAPSSETKPVSSKVSTAQPPDGAPAVAASPTDAATTAPGTSLVSTVPARAPEATNATAVDPASARKELESATRSELALDWASALRHYEKARELDPSMSVFIDAAISRVKASFGSGGLDAFRRARVYDALGRVDDAITWYERAAETLPSTDAKLAALRAGR
jgi:hypothetical protein